MSKKEKDTNQNKQKTMTNYERKQQMREEAKKQEKKALLIERTVVVVTVLALIALIASFPIRTYMALNETYVVVGGEEITKLEYDYNFYVTRNNYINEYNDYLTMLGLDTTADLSSQMYSETMTWKEFFDQQTVASMVRTKALVAAAKEAGFTYDTEADFKEFEKVIKEVSTEENVSVKTYLQEMYGPYSTMARLEEFVKEGFYANAYYVQKVEEQEPTEDEIQAYYDANSHLFDYVDYRIITIETEIAEDASNEEKEAAIANAKVVAEDALEKVATEGELREGASYEATSTWINEWLFADERKKGDTTVVHNTNTNQFHVMYYLDRYLDEMPSADLRMIMTTEEQGQSILDEWNNGGATEDYFATLADKYNAGTENNALGGYYQGVSRSGAPDEVVDWLFAEGRTEGDTACITSDTTGSTYILYYKGENIPTWKLDARAGALSEKMTAYLQEISADIKAEDVNNNFGYLENLTVE